MDDPNDLLKHAREPTPPFGGGDKPWQRSALIRSVDRHVSPRRGKQDPRAVSRAAADTQLPVHICGLDTRSVAELLVEVGDVRWFTEGGFARCNGTAPLAASTGGPGEPIRHRDNPDGNRRVDAVLYRMPLTQLRCEPRAQALYAQARATATPRRPVASSSATSQTSSTAE